MGAQLFGTDPYQQMSGMAAQHGGPGAGQLFDQQTAPQQYQQGLNRQGQAAGGLSGIAQLLAYLHQRKAGQNGQPGGTNPLQSPSILAPTGSAGMGSQSMNEQLNMSPTQQSSKNGMGSMDPILAFLLGHIHGATLSPQSSGQADPSQSPFQQSYGQQSMNPGNSNPFGGGSY